MLKHWMKLRSTALPLEGLMIYVHSAGINVQLKMLKFATGLSSTASKDALIS